MLSWFPRRFRIRAAIALAMLYAFCVVAPHAALAFTDAASAVHCLSEASGPAHVHKQDSSKTHVHADGTAHQHDDAGIADEPANADGKAPHGNCCGLFCVTALAGDAVPSLVVPAPTNAIGPALEQGLASRGPDRLIRPPIA